GGDGNMVSDRTRDFFRRRVRGGAPARATRSGAGDSGDRDRAVGGGAGSADVAARGARARRRESSGERSGDSPGGPTACVGPGGGASCPRSERASRRARRRGGSAAGGGTR